MDKWYFTTMTFKFIKYKMKFMKLFKILYAFSSTNLLSNSNSDLRNMLSQDSVEPVDDILKQGVFFICNPRGTIL